MRRPRALVVEDSSLLAGLLEEILDSLHADVVGPACTVGEALQLAENEEFQFAILDINLHGEMVFPVADVLTERGIPFLFASGYAAKDVLPPRYKTTAVLAKPYDLKRLRILVNALIETPGAPPSAPRGPV